MADENNAGGDGGKTQQTSDQTKQQETKFVGKYESQEAFEQGIREIAKTVDFPMPDEGSLIGENGKFKTVAEAEAAYKAFARVQKRNNTDTRQNEEEKKNEEDKSKASGGPEDKPLAIGESIPSDDMDAAAILESAGLKNEDVIQEWTKNKRLTDEQYAKLQSALPGVSRKMINDHLAVQEALAGQMKNIQDSIKAEAAKIAGGEQQLQNLLAGAKRFVPADEVEGLNEMLQNPKTYKTAIRVIMEHKRNFLGASKSQPTIEDGDTEVGDQPLRRNTQEYFKALKAARRGDETAKRQLARLAGK